MAQAYPDFGAGEGDTIGYQGSSSEWLYHVEVDNPSDDPITVLITVAAPGSPHPDPRFAGNIVTDYRKRKRLNETWWDIDVIFGPLSDQTLGQWRRSGRFGNETKRLDWSLGNIADDGRTVLDVPVQIGASKYALPNKDATPPQPWTEKFRTTSGLDINRILAIDPSSGALEVNDAILPLNYEITIPQLRITQIIDIMSYRWVCNSADWPFKSTRNANTYEQWSLIFSGFAFDDRVINLASAGPLWFSDVQIELLYKPIDDIRNFYGWRGTSQPDYFIDDQGFRHEVHERIGDGERRAVKNYVTYPEASFYNLFRIFGSSPVI